LDLLGGGEPNGEKKEELRSLKKDAPQFFSGGGSELGWKEKKGLSPSGEASSSYHGGKGKKGKTSIHRRVKKGGGEKVPLLRPSSASRKKKRGEKREFSCRKKEVLSISKPGGISKQGN